MPFINTCNPMTFQYNVGIGTDTNLVQTLTICGTNTRVESRAGGNTNAGAYYTVYNGASLVGQSSQFVDNAGNWILYTGTTSEAERLRVTAAGNVGIGTTSPSDNLHIAASEVGNVGIAIQNTNASYSSQIRFLNSAGGECSAITYVQSSNFLAINVNGGNRLNITSAGNVGIGTESPGATLTVTGPNATGAFFQAANDGAGGAVFCRINASSYPYNSFNFFNGNMGIGAYASLSNVNLQICDGNANGTDDMVRLMQCLPGNHAFYRAQRCGGATMIMGPTRNSGDGCIPSESAIIWTTTNNPIVIGTCGRQRMRFATDGNAVLGGTSANIVGFTGTVLTVNGGGNYQGYEVSTSNVTRMTMVSDGNNGYLSTRVAGMCLIFEAGAASEKMRITSDGNVGINRTNPFAPLEVYKSCSGGLGGFIAVNNNGTAVGNETAFMFADGGSTTVRAAISSTTEDAPYCGDLKFKTGVGTYDCLSTRMIIKGNGTIGINTASPSYRLHVNGTFYAAGSSIKYKEGICNYDTDSCLFMCLKPVTYQYKDEWQHLGRELKSQSQIGLIAEDVAEVMPELAILVNEDDEKVVRNVDYEKLSVVLLKEVQKLRQEVDELKNNK